MKCPKCQHELPEDANFCMNCGYNLKSQKQIAAIDLNRPHSYTPKFLADQILTNRSAMVGERKRVTVLFADVANYTAMAEKLDPEQVHQIMDGCFTILMNEIHKHQGTINQFTGDGVMALFGAPIALENHAQNACRAALSIQNTLQEFSGDLKSRTGLEFKMRIGLNSGPVIVGSIGDDLRMDYTAIGDTTNLAARMESMAAPCTILVSHNTYKRVDKQFEFKPLGKLEIKGKENALEAYELLKDKIDRPRLGLERQIFSEMVGRENELCKIELQVMKAINGEGSVVNVIGEAGIGKSRLIAELKNRDIVKHATFLEGRAISIGRNLSFHPIINLLKHWARIKEEDTSAAAINKLETAVRNVCQAEAAEVFPFIATLMGMKLSGRYAERMAGIDGEALEKLIFKNVRDLLIKSTELNPLIIVIEDLHWADNSSIELLESLFRLAETRRIVFINVFRPNHPDTSDRITASLKEKLPVYYVEIQLQPLTEELSEMLINNMLNIKGLSNALIDQIIERAGGNPFFIEEVVRSFVDEGAVVKTNGEFRVTEKIDKMVVPQTINDVLMARIDRLDADTRELVKVASVIGRSFFYRILNEVAKTIHEIDNRLAHLKQIELIREQKRMEELEYLFKHALAQEAAYESILSQKRKELHLKIADAIERIFQERLHEFYGILAYHYSSGDNLDKAEEYMLRAGEEALKASASNEALHYYQKAMALYINKHGGAIDKHKLANMEENIAYAFLNKGFYAESVDYFDRAASHRGEKVNRKMIVIIPQFLLHMALILRHLYLPAIRRKKIPTETDKRIMQKTMKTATAISQVDVKRCLVENIRSASHAFKYDISKSQAYFNLLVGSGILFSASGLSLSLTYRFLEYCRKSVSNKDSDVLLYLYKCAKFVHSYYIGSWKEKLNNKSIMEALNIGDFFFGTGQLLYLCYMGIELGDFKRCEVIIAQLHRIYEEYNFEHAESDVFILKTKLLLQRRDLFNALNYADKAISQANKTSWIGRTVESLATKARCEIFCQNLDAAGRTITSAEEFIRQVGKEAIFIDWYRDYLMAKFLYNMALLEDYILKNRPNEATKFKKAAFKIGNKCLSYTKKKVADERTESFKLMGTYYWLIGNQKKALKWWGKSAAEGEHLGARPDLSRTYFEIGRRLLEPKSKYKELNGITAEDYLVKARALFEEMDLQWDLDELDKIKAAS